MPGCVLLCLFVAEEGEWTSPGATEILSDGTPYSYSTYMDPRTTLPSLVSYLALCLKDEIPYSILLCTIGVSDVPKVLSIASSSGCTVLCSISLGAVMLQRRRCLSSRAASRLHRYLHLLPSSFNDFLTFNFLLLTLNPHHCRLLPPPPSSFLPSARFCLHSLLLLLLSSSPISITKNNGHPTPTPLLSATIGLNTP